jgi:colanic acid/amylovoran biosynthesis glycosyltransferase
VKLAYLLSQYPTIAHTYLLREVRGLRELGWDIGAVSILPPDRGAELMLEAETKEAARTFYVLRGGIPAILTDQFRVLFKHPVRYLAGLAYAIRLAGFDLRKCLYLLAYFAEAVRAGRWMHAQGITHFHSHYSTTVALLIVKVFPLTFSATIHGSAEFIDPIGFHLPQKIQAALFVCAISFYGRSQMAQLVPYDVWERIEVASLGIDPSEYDPAPFRESPDPYEIVCVGKLVSFKAQHLLLECVHRLIAEGRNLRLRLVGDGPDRPSLEARIRKLNLSDRVIIEGWKNHDEVREFYRRADIFALASSAEGVPVVLMEAMAMRIPCVATRITGIPELIRDGIDGLLVTPSDPDELTSAIARLLDDSTLRRRLAEAGRIRVQEKYHLAANVARLSEIFKRRLAS